MPTVMRDLPRPPGAPRPDDAEEATRPSLPQATPTAVPVGLTPRVLLGRCGPARLYWYPAQTAAPEPVPLLLVPHLGIRPAYVYDLCPGASFIEGFVRAGFDVYFVDWGLPAPHADGFGVEEAVLDVLPRLVACLLQHAETAGFDLVGYSSGVPLALCYVATHPDAPVRSLSMLVGAVDFARGDLSMLGQMAAGFPSLVPLAAMGFRLPWPTGPLPSLANWWWTHLLEQRRAALVGDAAPPAGSEDTAEDEAPSPAQEAQARWALYQWLSDWQGFPRTYLDQWVRWFHQENRLVAGGLRLRGRRVDLAAITQPVLVVAAAADTVVPPAAARALLDLVSSAERRYVEVPGGHLWLLVAPEARREAWPALQHWLRSQASSLTPQVDVQRTS